MICTCQADGHGEKGTAQRRDAQDEQRYKIQSPSKPRRSEEEPAHGTCVELKQVQILSGELFRLPKGVDGGKTGHL